MTDSFNADQAPQGTTDQVSNIVDNNTDNVFDAGNKLQQQIDGMQKRMGDKDTHITTIESENQDLRESLADINERLDAMGSVEDALTRMKENNNSNQDTTLDEDTLKSTMKSLLAETTAEEKATGNFNKVADTLTKLYGADKVNETVENVARENGLTFQDMIMLARKSPDAVFRMAGVKASSPTSAAPSQSTQVGYNTGNQNKEHKLAEFSKMRKENPKEFYKSEVQKQFRDLCLSK